MRHHLIPFCFIFVLSITCHHPRVLGKPGPDPQNIRDIDWSTQAELLDSLKQKTNADLQALEETSYHELYEAFKDNRWTYGAAGGLVAITGGLGAVALFRAAGKISPGLGLSSERVFLLAGSGACVLVSLTGLFVVGYQGYQAHNRSATLVELREIVDSQTADQLTVLHEQLKRLHFYLENHDIYLQIPRDLIQSGTISLNVSGHHPQDGGVEISQENIIASIPLQPDLAEDRRFHPTSAYVHLTPELSNKVRQVLKNGVLFAAFSLNFPEVEARNHFLLDRENMLDAVQAQNASWDIDFSSQTDMNRSDNFATRITYSMNLGELFEFVQGIDSHNLTGLVFNGIKRTDLTQTSTAR